MNYSPKARTVALTPEPSCPGREIFAPKPLSNADFYDFDKDAIIVNIKSNLDFSKSVAPCRQIKKNEFTYTTELAKVQSV